VLISSIRCCVEIIDTAGVGLGRRRVPVTHLRHEGAEHAAADPPPPAAEPAVAQASNTSTCARQMTGEESEARDEAEGVRERPPVCGERGGGGGEDGGAGERGGWRAAPLLDRHPPRRGLALRVRRVHSSRALPAPGSLDRVGQVGCLQDVHASDDLQWAAQRLTREPRRPMPIRSSSWASVRTETTPRALLRTQKSSAAAGGVDLGVGSVVSTQLDYHRSLVITATAAYWTAEGRGRHPDIGKYKYLP
jgi:hypothetical protein